MSRVKTCYLPFAICVVVQLNISTIFVSVVAQAIQHLQYLVGVYKYPPRYGIGSCYES